jgi:molybdopterin biosynthesis enzyme
MLKNITVEEANKLLLKLPVELETEAVHISSSLGRVLSQDIYANINVPPFDRSPFDGLCPQGSGHLWCG